ncbi:MAG: zinc-ribbon domain-containing protein, partial [Ktedonobacterales bacterium]
MTNESCRHCGAEVPEGALSCTTCGAPVVATPTMTGLGETAQRAAIASTPAPLPANGPASGQYIPYPAPAGVWSAPGQLGQAPYPTAYPTAYPPAYPAGAGYPQAQPYGYPWAYYAPQYGAPQRAMRAPGEVYAQVLSWIVTVVSGIGILCGLIVTLLAVISAISGSGDDLSFLGAITGFSLAPIIGGAFGLWYGITGIRRKSSPRFGLPNAWLIFGLTVLAIGGGVALWQYNFSQTRAPGAALGVLPLAALTGVLPALTILAFTTQRLRNPSSRRRVWMSLFYGMTLAPLIAVILETILTLIIALALHLSAQDTQSVLGQPG